MVIDQHAFNTRKELAQYIEKTGYELHSKLKSKTFTLRDAEHLAEICLIVIKLLEFKSKTKNKPQIIKCLRNLTICSLVIAKEFERQKTDLVARMRSEICLAKDYCQTLIYDKSTCTTYSGNQILLSVLKQISDKLEIIDQNLIIENTVTPVLEEWQECCVEFRSLLGEINDDSLQEDDRILKHDLLDDFDILFNYNIKELSTWQHYIQVLCCFQQFISDHELMRQSPGLH